MANKEKEGDNITNTPVKNRLNIDAIKDQIKEKADHYHKLTEKKNELIGQLQQVESAISEYRGRVVELQELIQDTPSVNGEV
jgi:chaperonin cofactor prefoldin